ncbi:MAG: hypothetical protein Q7J20_11845 [Candidatus Nitrotoga sp.]|nr:hypothetical protein [Candidatus Nitrotoga sp.]
MAVHENPRLPNHFFLVHGNLAHVPPGAVQTINSDTPVPTRPTYIERA